VLAPLAATGGWVPSARPGIDWIPGFSGEAASLRQTFERSDRIVGMHVVYYRNQAKGRELVTSSNQMVLADNFRWREVGRSAMEVRFAGARVDAMRSVIADPRQNRIVAYGVYWVDGTVTGSAYVAKARLAWSRLTGGNGDAALVVFFAPEQEGRDAARDAMEALSPAVADMLEATRPKR
jgi:EpsI family protein